MRKTLLVTTLLLLISLLSALTMDEAKQMALKNNPKYLAQLDSYQSAKWTSQQTMSSMLPSMSLSGSYLYMDPSNPTYSGMSMIPSNKDTRSISLGLSQPLFMGGKLWQAYQIAKTSEELARLTLENTRLSILADTENKYFSVLQLAELLSISEKDLQGSTQNLSIAQIRYDGGTLSFPDLLKIKSKKATKEVALIQAQTAMELAKQDLSSFLELTEWSDLQPVSLDNEQPLINKMLDWKTAETNDFTLKANQQAVKNNLGLKSAAQATRLSKRAYSIAKGTFLPTVMLSASRSWSDAGIERYEFSGRNTLTLSASLPILPFWGNYSTSRKAWYDVQKSTFDLKSAGDGINLAVKASALNLISAARQIQASKLALDYTQQTYDQLIERFANNMLSATDMLDAEVMLQAARINLTNSSYAYLKAKTSLLLALGTDDSNIIIALTE